jgi:hypothetical protein
MLSKEYLKTARMLRRAALRITDRMVAGRLSSLVEDCERQAEKAAQADAAKALAREGLKFFSPVSRSHAQLQAERAGSSPKGRLKRLKTQQPRRKSAFSAGAN